MKEAGKARMKTARGQKRALQQGKVVNRLDQCRCPALSLLRRSSWHVLADRARVSIPAFLSVLSVLALGSMLAGCAGGERLEEAEPPRTIAVETNAQPTGSRLPQSINDLLRQVSPSFVTLVVRQPRKKMALDAGISRGVSSGSGFIVDAQGHVITAGHVAVNRNYRVSARGEDGRIHEGTVVAVRPDNDIGLLRLQDRFGRPVVPAASPCLKPGQAVFSLGRPRGGSALARIGTVKSMHFSRVVHYGNYGYPDAIVLRMSTRRGESGGPVFNERGELVGMVVSTLSANGRPLNLAHAIPLPPIARFYCQNAACGPRWQRLAAMNTKSCP